MFLREDQFAIHVAVAGVALDTSVWTSLEGGDIEGQNVNTRPGGMAPAVELGGPVSRSDATVKRQYSSDKLHPLILKLEAAAGKAAVAVSYTPLDADGNPAGLTITMTGILKSVMRPNADANASAAGFLSLVIGLNQQAVSASN